MILSKSKILAIDCIPIDPKEFSQEWLVQRMGYTFEKHNGVVAFYGYVYSQSFVSTRLERHILERLNFLIEEGVHQKESAAGARLFGIEVSQNHGFSKQEIIRTMSEHGVNCLKSTRVEHPAIHGCTIMSGPQEFVTSKFIKRNDRCCTVGDFQLFF